MNYNPNATHWNTGDLVLHDADAKREEMLMIVIGYTPEGLCRTRYAKPNQMNQDGVKNGRKPKPRVWENDIRYLHDPKRFGVSVEL